MPEDIEEQRLWRAIGLVLENLLERAIIRDEVFQPSTPPSRWGEQQSPSVVTSGIQAGVGGTLKEYPAFPFLTSIEDVEKARELTPLILEGFNVEVEDDVVKVGSGRYKWGGEEKVFDGVDLPLPKKVNHVVYITFDLEQGQAKATLYPSATEVVLKIVSP